MSRYRYRRLNWRHSGLHPEKDTIACPDCGLVQRLPPSRPKTVIECARCEHRLTRATRVGIEAPLAFSAAGLTLLLPAALMPLMSLVSFGIQRQNWLPTGVGALWRDGFNAVAALIFLFSIGIPFLYLGILVWVLGSLQLRAGARLGRLFRWAVELRPWAMTEVYLVGCCVAYTRLQDVGNVHVGVGGWCLMGATLAVLVAGITLDESVVWDAMPYHGEAWVPSARSIGCDTCDLLLPARQIGAPCPRCGTRLRRRKSDTLARTLALVIAGFVLYLPANLLPVLDIERFGHDQPNTILTGVRELIAAGLWPLAIVVFAASIVVPLMKLCGLSLMLAMTHRRSGRWLFGRTLLYRFIDFIGRWSSIDLFMISILVALVQFGALTRVKPEGGAMAFAAVVVITMFASRCFDPRVMWDRAARIS
ncbi:MAG: PqiA/YebS family transporter subunit [Steroidobacteraceae bacterium]